MDLKKLEEEIGIESFSKEDTEDVSQEVEEIINLLNETEDGMISLNGEDESLEELMEREQNTELEEIDTDVINDISVYDTERKELSEKEMEQIENFEEPEEEHLEKISLEEFSKEFSEESEKESGISNVIIYSIIGVLLSAIIIAIIFFIFAFKKVNAINLEKQIEIENEKVQATFVPEESNSAYLEIANRIDNFDIILEKISIDSKYIKISIISDMDYSKYDFVLTDGGNKLYPTDINFIKQDNGKFDIRFYNDDTILNEYTLSIRSIGTGETIDFIFEIPKIEKSNTVRYLNNIIDKKGDKFSLNITGGIFSEGGSSIYYTLEPEKDANFEIQQGFLNTEDLITAKENNKNLEPLGQKVLSVRLKNGSILGRMDFEKVSRYDSNLIISFNNLYKKYDINKSIDLGKLNAKEKEGGVEFQFDKYKLFIESMPKFDDLFVLVFHGEDTTISTENREPTFNRVEVLLNAEIALTTSSGMEIILKPSSVKSSNIGTDMIFKLSSFEKNLLLGLEPASIKINVQSALIRTDDVHIPINLSRAMDRKITADRMMEQQIKEAFISRLNYKYHSKNNIKGFSENILKDLDLMQEYQVTKDRLNPSYDIVILSEKLENNDVYALVQEIEKYTLNGKEYTSYKTHKIEAIYEEEKGWTIIEDEIIK